MFFQKLKLFFAPQNKTFISINDVEGRNGMGGLIVTVIIKEISDKGFFKEETETEYIFQNFYDIKNNWYFYKIGTDDIPLPIERLNYSISKQFVNKLVDEFCIANNIELDGEWRT